jgi:hypothetical protein
VELGTEVEGDVCNMDEKNQPLGFGWAYPIKSMEALNPAWFFFLFLLLFRTYIVENIGLITFQHVMCKNLNG